MTERLMLQRAVERILRVFPDTRQILLFGSHARGTADAGSDYDLLVVTPTALHPAERVAAILRELWGLTGPFDVLVVTPEELERLRSWTSTVVYRALREGQVLHEAA